MLPLPSTWKPQEGLSSKEGILELWDTLVPVISGTYTNAVCSVLPHHGPGETVSIVGCCTEPYYFAAMLDGPAHGSRLRPGLKS